jgi:integrase
MASTTTTARITRATIEAAWKRRSEGAREIIRDSQCRGLALLVGQRSMSWLLAWKPRGTNPETGKRWATQSLVIGTPATHGPEAAREEAARLKLAVRDGNDPAAERKARIHAASTQRARTASAILERYATTLPHRPRMKGAPGKISPRHAKQEAAYVKKALTIMDAADKPISEVDVPSISRMLTELAGHPAEAVHCHGALGRFMDWAMEHGFSNTNPVEALPRSKRPRPPQSRDVFLTPEDIAVLWKTADTLTHPVWRDLARFLLVVPARAGTVLKLDWPDIDMAKTIWNQPALVTKNGEPHRLHLPPLALEVLKARQMATDGKGLVFPAPQSGKSITMLRDIRATLAAATGITGWTWHDMRRSFASAVAEAGIAEPVADGVLNHRMSATRGGVLGVYQRASRWPEQVRAMELWGQLLTNAIGGVSAASNVVEIASHVG